MTASRSPTLLLEFAERRTRAGHALFVGYLNGARITVKHIGRRGEVEIWGLFSQHDPDPPTYERVPPRKP